MRLVILGGPRTGKTTLARTFGTLGVPVVSTDIYDDGRSWSAQSEAVAALFNAPGEWVIEGVTTVRALRKWMRAHAGKPCDKVIYLVTPYPPISKAQFTLLKGVAKVWVGVAPELKRRGVEIELR